MSRDELSNVGPSNPGMLNLVSICCCSQRRRRNSHALLFRTSCRCWLQLARNACRSPSFICRMATSAAPANMAPDSRSARRASSFPISDFMCLSTRCKARSACLCLAAVRYHIPLHTSSATAPDRCNNLRITNKANSAPSRSFPVGSSSFGGDVENNGGSGGCGGELPSRTIHAARKFGSCWMSSVSSLNAFCSISTSVGTTTYVRDVSGGTGLVVPGAAIDPYKSSASVLAFFGIG
mmetsp:Transcript_7830/g.22667  ORF Transcript_7830/g.22667 Transcript_7830/m.22667 type:complete len:237 (-) Transcript_7830:22-732(-)